MVQGKGVEHYLADATLYLEFFGIVAVGWQWLLQGVAAQRALRKECTAADKNFYTGKMFALRYFFNYEMPKTAALARRLTDGDGLTVEMKSAFFG